MPHARQALEELLDSLGESAQFATSGSLTPVIPGLEVEGAGPIRIPVAAADAKRLIARAVQAPYGRGERTIVDTDVRRVWQIEPSQITLRNAAWKDHVAAIVDAVRDEFGIRQKVTPHLYKLLVYEKGSFFAPHRDTEKTPGMFATLVVCLPSRHQGGTLLVRHDGQTQKIDFGGKNAEFTTQYAAFYADCEHEIKPVTSGYRICLVYNLAIAGKKQPTAPKNGRDVEQAAELLAELFREPSSNLSKIAIPFEHQYTEAGLDPRQLKGSDRALADVLVRAAASLDYQCYFALLTHHQSGEPDYDTYDFDDHWGRRSYYESYDEDEEEDEEEDGEGDDSGVRMGEVYEEELTLDHWLDPAGRRQPFGEMHLEENEILYPDDTEGWLVRQEVHEATGNEGVSMDRWYRQGVIVIWPRDRYFAILAGEGPASAVPALEQMAARSKKPDTLEACRTFAEEIINCWSPPAGFGAEWAYAGRMLKLLERIGTVELVQRFISEVLPHGFDGSVGKPLQRLCQRFGWESFGDALRDFLAGLKPGNYYTRLDHAVAICEALCCAPPAMTKERLAVCRPLAGELVRLIERWDKGRSASWYLDEEKRTGVVADMVHLLATVAASSQMDSFLDHVLADEKHYDLHEVLIPDVKAMQKWLPQAPAAQAAASRLLRHCLAKLRAATAQPIEPPGDWRRDAKLGCKCEDCQTLSRFLRDPEQRVGRFPLRKDRRQHLHQQIDRHQCDCTHVTERIGSPQTLVCTKTQASYERRKKQFAVNTKLLAELEALATGAPRAVVRRSSGRRAKGK
jgi:hypothetical protein